MSDVATGFLEPEDLPPRYDLHPEVASWIRALRSQNLSENTQRIYRRAGDSFAAYLLDEKAGYQPASEGGHPAPTSLEEVHREHVQAYIADLIKRTSAGNAHQHFRSLKTFFNWLVNEEELTRSPMRTMKPPEVGEVVVPVIPDDALKKLLAICKGTSFKQRRDTAIIMLFLDTGVRLSELTERSVGHLDLDLMVFYVLGKGGRERAVPFGRTTSVAVDRYLRALGKHRKKTLEKDDALWWSVKRGSRMTIWGVGTMIENRCKEAGIPHIHPHQFRHTFAHLWKLNGGNEDDLMRITGWKSRQMLSRYAASSGAERARLAHKTLSPGDRL
ncbi:tyrosine-type recombinase/integrase [Streptomyces sp. NPDC048389]|uniref:tyrosine-type recombinase/integrase n=1 Tax=Streptomyces sp. NPDC048389 TaxID=3154622 RepID=UPI0034529C33